MTHDDAASPPGPAVETLRLNFLRPHSDAPPLQVTDATGRVVAELLPDGTARLGDGYSPEEALRIVLLEVAKQFAWRPSVAR